MIEKSVLDNGLTVITESMPGSKSAALGFWVRVGSRDEKPSQMGLSHFMEHMLFKGTTTRSAWDISSAFDSIGAELNAFTSKEYTCFYSRMIEEHFDYAFEVLADMLVNPLFSPETIVPESEVVIEEISRNEDTPEDLIFDVFMNALFHQNSLGRPVLGTREHVASFSSQDLFVYHKQYYTAANIIVVACGAVDHNKTLEYAHAFLSSLPTGNYNTRTLLKEDTHDLAVLTKDVEQAHLLLGMPAISSSDPNRFAYNILDAALGGGMSSRLFTEIREKRGLVYAVYTMLQTYEETGSFMMYAGTNPNNIQEILEVSQNEFKKIAETKLDEEELQRVREFVCGNYALAMESSRNHMTRLGKMALNNIELLPVSETIERMRSVTADDVYAAAQSLFTKKPTIALIGALDKEKIEGMLQ